MKREKWRNQPIASTILVAINVLVFLVCNFTGDTLYSAGSMSVYGVIWEKEYGRVLWAMFLHGDASHIFNNMLLLFFMGSMIEKEIGHIRFAVLYFLSGIGGNLFSLLVKVLNQDMYATIGASGAVFGLDGVLLALVLFSGKKMENVTPARMLLMIVYSLYNGFVGANIDNAAHVGGLVIGFVAGAIMCVFRRHRQRDEVKSEVQF